MNSCAKKKTAVITGGTGGLGLAVARTMAQAGYQIALVDMNPAAGEKAAAEKHKTGKLAKAARQNKKQAKRTAPQKETKKSYCL